jgi:hypothetical protein
VRPTLELTTQYSHIFDILTAATDAITETGISIQDMLPVFADFVAATENSLHSRRHEGKIPPTMYRFEARIVGRSQGKSATKAPLIIPESAHRPWPVRHISRALQ